MAELARLGHVTRARVTQMMDLLLLTPDIQEEVLHLPAVAEEDLRERLGQRARGRRERAGRGQAREGRDLRDRPGCGKVSVTGIEAPEGGGCGDTKSVGTELGRLLDERLGQGERTSGLVSSTTVRHQNGG
jgi:hypothetical protein